MGGTVLKGLRRKIFIERVQGSYLFMSVISKCITVGNVIYITRFDQRYFKQRAVSRCLRSQVIIVKVGPPVHNYEHEAGSYGDGFT